jgi:hypothetical protein
MGLLLIIKFRCQWLKLSVTVSSQNKLKRVPDGTKKKHDN